MRNDFEFKRDPRDAVIPTPEEEAVEDARREGNKRGSRAIIAMLLMMGAALFHQSIADTALGVVEFLGSLK